MRPLLRLFVVAATAIAIAACTSGSGSAPGPSIGSPPRATASAAASPAATTDVGATPIPSPSLAPATVPGARPEGWLIIEGGSPRVGDMGTGCWSSGGSLGCADAGWRVPDPGIEAAPGADCEVRFSDGTPILYGRVSAFPADAADPQEALHVLVVRGDEPAGSPFRFDCPGAGDWVLVAVLHAAPGDQSYFWRLLSHWPRRG